MKVLIVGSGGREHAIAYSVAKSDKVDKIYCTPGNAGIAEYAECAPIGAMEFDKITAFAKEKGVDLVIVGMDDPLVGGLVDVPGGRRYPYFWTYKGRCYSGGLESIFQRSDEKVQHPDGGLRDFFRSPKSAGIS